MSTAEAIANSKVVPDNPESEQKTVIFSFNAQALLDLLASFPEPTSDLTFRSALQKLQETVGEPYLPPSMVALTRLAVFRKDHERNLRIWTEYYTTLTDYRAPTQHVNLQVLWGETPKSAVVDFDALYNALEESPSEVLVMQVGDQSTPITITSPDRTYMRLVGPVLCNVRTIP